MKIIENKKDEYDAYVKMNSNDSYSKGVVDAGERVGIALDEGKTPEQAIEALTEGDGNELTGYMAGAAIMATVHFNPRGQELKEAWNNRFGVKDAKGVVNPAIMTVSQKE